MSVEIIISLLAALGVGGILGALLNRRFEQQKQTSDHDIKIFNQSNKILTEQKIISIADQLISNHSIRDDDFVLLTRLCEFFKQTGNHYLDKKVGRENQKFLDNLVN